MNLKGLKRKERIRRSKGKRRRSVNRRRRGKRKRRGKRRRKRKTNRKDKRTVTNKSISRKIFKGFPPNGVDHVESCTLKAEDLVDGLRILTRMGGHFYPSRLTDISAPDIYGIVVDKERGNKPHIYSQEEVLNKAVRLNI